jgi:hypothetical protein
MRAPRFALLAALALVLIVPGCGDSGGVSKGKEADRADGVAEAGAQTLARVVEACRNQHPTYRECDESDELEVFSQFCLQRNGPNDARCGGAHSLEGLVFGNDPGQVEVAESSNNGYRIRAYSTAEAVFSIVKRPGRTPRRECVAPAGKQGRCVNGTW